MEHRLMLLKERMQRDQQERENYKAGAKWGSARTDKGSLTSYSKDVHDKHKKRVAADGDPVLKLMMEQAAVAQRQALLGFEEVKSGSSKKVSTQSAAPYKPMKASDMTTSRSAVSTSSLFSKGSAGAGTSHISKDDSSMKSAAVEKLRQKQIRPLATESWSVDQVGQWLETLGLQQYTPVFEQNEIKGDVLLELSLEDLDYMSIVALGHRKTILRGIEALKSGVTPNLSSLAATSTKNKVEVASTTKTLHWSHAEPLSSKKVSGGRDILINSADYLTSNEPIDEDAERAAFTKAVMDWRHSGKKESTETKVEKSPVSHHYSNGSELRASSMSYLLSAEPLDEEAEGAAFTRAVMEWRNSGKEKVDENPVIFGAKSSSDPQGSGLWHNPFSGEDGPILSQPKTPPLSARGLPSLADGSLDEAKEHEEFAKAVESWRRGKSSNMEEKLKTVADKLSEDLDEEFRINKQRLEREQQAILEKIAEVSQLTYVLH